MKNWCKILLLFVLVFLVGVLAWRNEPFTSPGTLVQLSSSHVPTSRDIKNSELYVRQVEHDLYDMTESD